MTVPPPGGTFSAAPLRVWPDAYSPRPARWTSESVTCHQASISRAGFVMRPPGPAVLWVSRR